MVSRARARRKQSVGRCSSSSSSNNHKCLRSGRTREMVERIRHDRPTGGDVARKVASTTGRGGTVAKL